MKTIVFMTPPSTKEDQCGELSKAGGTSPPLGLLLLAAIARKNGYEAHVIDSQAQGFDHIKAAEEALNYSPHVIGITSVTATFLSAAKLAQTLKHLQENVLVVVGGPHITALPAESLEKFPAIDIGVAGEGEITFVELLDTYFRGGDLGRIKGIVYRENGGIITTPLRELIKNLDDLPVPAWDLLDGFPDRYNLQIQSVLRLPATSLCSSRGCPHKCIFCDKRSFGSTFRAHSVDYTINLVEHLYNNFKIRDFQFEDDYFMVNKKRLLSICRLLQDKKLDLVWSCQSRAEKMTLDVLKEMKKAGCWLIMFGIESGDQGILDVIRKGLKIEDVNLAIELTHKAKIQSKGFFITGNFGETLETLENTRKFIQDSKLNDISLHYFTPFPGSEAYRVAHEYGTFDKDWTKMNFFDVVFVPNGLSANTLVNSQKKTYRKFYSRPRVIFSYLKRVRNLPLFLLYVKSFFSLIRYVFLRKQR